MGREDTHSVQHRRVRFVEALGKGGFGSVFLADVTSGDDFVQRVAVKILNKEMEAHADIVARQRDEGRLLAQLNHDHIVKVFDMAEVSGRPAVFMEYVPGVDAGRLLQEDALPPRAALELAAGAASALEAAWGTVSPVTGRELQAIHRDIKPSNLLLSAFGTVKVLDFGIARADFDREGKTMSVQLGTARYMAPEQWLDQDLSRAVDMFALGISMVEMLSGKWATRLPLREDKYDIALMQLVQSVRDPRWGMVWWRRLEELLLRMMAFDPDERPAPGEVQEVCIELSEEVGGQSLRRLAKERVPPLIESHRAKMKGVPLLPDADLVFEHQPDPSILTAGKTTATLPMEVVVLPDRRIQALMLLGIALAFAWLVTA